jgi:hypothetical protein
MLRAAEAHRFGGRFLADEARHVLKHALGLRASLGTEPLGLALGDFRPLLLNGHRGFSGSRRCTHLGELRLGLVRTELLLSNGRTELGRGETRAQVGFGGPSSGSGCGASESVGCCSRNHVVVALLLRNARTVFIHIIRSATGGDGDFFAFQTGRHLGTRTMEHSVTHQVIDTSHDR